MTTLISPQPKLQFFSAAGAPLVGGKLYTYAAGTTTPLATYTDSTGGSSNTNPVILDSRGEASVWLGNSSYKFVLQDSTGATIWTVDNLDGTLPVNAKWLTGVNGTDTILAAVTAPTITAYAAGQSFIFKSVGANTTTTPTLNINSLGAKSIKKEGTTSLTVGDIANGAVVMVVYDGTNFQLLNPSISNQFQSPPALGNVTPNAVSATTLTAAGYSGAFPRNNKIINGAMVIDQRHVGALQTGVASGDYLVDRWMYTMGGTTAVLNAQQSTDVPTGNVYQNSQSLVVTTADAAVASGDYAFLQQRIEGFNITDLVGTTFTLSFWVKSPKTGVHCVAFRNSSPNRSYVMEYTVNAANTWESKSVTVTGGLTTGGTWSYTTGIGLVVTFALMAGATYQTNAGSWQVGNYSATSNQVNVLDTVSNTFKLTGVQLYIGTSNPNHDSRSFGQELALCQRYYCKTFTYLLAPAQNIGSGSSIGIIAPVANQSWVLNWRFPVEMRTAPSTITGYNPSAADANWSAGGVAISIAGASGSNAILQASAPTIAAGTAAYANATAEAEL